MKLAIIDCTEFFQSGFCTGFHPPHYLSARMEGEALVEGALSQTHPMVHLKLVTGAGGSLPVLTEGGACVCHYVLFHSYLQIPAAFTTLVSLCGHIETERNAEYTL